MPTDQTARAWELGTGSASRDSNISDLTRQQIGQLDKVIEVFGDPPSEEDVPPVVQVLEVARLWFLKRREIMRKEGGHL
jgi:hypothetical protein